MLFSTNSFPDLPPMNSVNRFIPKNLTGQIKRKIEEFYEASRDPWRWQKYDFDSTVTIGGQKVSLFQTDKLALALFENGHDYLHIEAFFLNPFKRNISQLRFLMAETIDQFVAGDYWVSRVIFSLKPRELVHHGIFTIGAELIFIDDQLLCAELKDEVALRRYICLLSEGRRLLQRKLNTVALIKLTDRLCGRTGKSLLQGLYALAVLNGSEEFRRRIGWLSGIAVGREWHNRGMSLLIPPLQLSQFNANMMESDFAGLIVSLQQTLERISVLIPFAGCREKRFTIDGAFNACLKDSVIELNQEYDPQFTFLDDSLVRVIKQQNTKVIDALKRVTDDWLKNRKQ